MLTGRLRGVRRIRIVAAVIGSLSVLAMIVVGCTAMTQGTPTVKSGEAPVYQASVSASIEASAAMSSSRENERQQSLTTKAVHTVCEDMSSSSADAVSALNTYVSAVNSNGNVQGTSGPAVDALNHTADVVAAGISDTLAPQLRDALTDWVDAARGAATAVTNSFGPDTFNAAVGRLNDSRSLALRRCDDAY